MIPFDDIASRLLARGESFCRDLFPAGVKEGAEFKIGNLRGDKGRSLSINLTTGVWRDFAGDEGGSDLISLYAAVHSMSQADAARTLAPEYSNGHDHSEPVAQHMPAAIHADPPPPGPPAIPNAEALYRYTDTYYVARFARADGKTFSPYTWDGSTWNRKAPPKPRPLYGLDDLASRPNAPVLVVEGEKCRDVAQAALMTYTAVTWHGGAQAASTANWSVLTERDVTLWPDADEPGRKAMTGLAAVLLPICSSVQILDIQDRSGGWDIADAVHDGVNVAEFIDSHSKVLRAPEPKQSKQAAKPAPEQQPAYYLWQQLGLDQNDKGPYPTEANAMRILQAHTAYAGKIWLDSFAQRVMLDRDTADTIPLNEIEMMRIQAWMQAALQLQKMPLSAVERAVKLVADADQRHPVRDWLASLEWDGVERLGSLMYEGFGASETPYSQAVGRCWLVGMVARVMVPGCKFDNVPVFEGPQGIRKSTALAIIGGPWFLESNENPLRNRKDFLLSTQGKWLIEIPEIDKIGGRYGSLEDLTGMITIRVDNYRVPYGATTQDYPRQCVFTGTANRSQWQPDETGGRRYWPIRCGQINTEWLEESRSQLFAEAYSRFQSGEPWHDIPSADAAREQEERRERDEWETIIELYADHYPDRQVIGQLTWHPRTERLEYLTVQGILGEALDIPIARWDKSSQMRVARSLKALGYTRIRISEGVSRRWVYKK